MSKKVKILVSLLLAFIGAMAVVFYIVSTKINPEMIKKSAIEAIEQNLKDSKATIGEVSYSLGFNVKLYLKELKIVSKKNGDLASLGEAKVEVPILAILTNGGTVDIKVDAPEVVYKELPGGGSNWEAAIASKANSKKAVKSNSDKKIETKEVELPSFIEKSRIDLKITNLKAVLLQLEKEKSEVMINKILFKNVNLKKTTAFEIVSKLDYSLDKEKSISANAQLVGEIALNNFLKNGAIDTNMLLNIDDVKADWLPLKVPALKNVIQFKMTDQGTIQAEVRSNSSGVFNIEVEAGIDKEFTVVSLNKILAEVNLKGLNSTLNNELKEGLKDIELEKSLLKLNGSSVLNLKNNSLEPNLNFSLEKPMVIKVAGQNISTSVVGTFKGSDVKAKVTNELMSGVATIDVNTKIDPMNLPDDLANYKAINAKALITNIKLEKPFLQELLYGGKTEKAKNKGDSEQAAIQHAEEKATPISMPPFKLLIEGKHIFIANQEMNVNGAVDGGGSSVNIPNIKFTYGSGIASVNAKTSAKATNNITSQFALNLKNMDMAGLNAFLPPIISEIKGKYQGKVAGKVNKKNTLSYDVKADVTAKDGELKNLNLASFLMPLVDSLSFLKGKVDEDKMKITDKFETLGLSAIATEKLVSIKKFNFVGNNKSATIKARGTVSMLEAGESEVKADIVVKDVSPQIKGYTGKEEIPVLLKGKGFGLLPQAKYTSDKLTERIAKKEIKKQEKQIKKSIDKEKNKLKKQLEDKAKDLLKGFSL